jgi:hypothetical protein
MKNECMIVRDLLPLYVEDLVSDETRIFIEEHLDTCEDCRKTLEQFQESPEMSNEAGAVPLKVVRRRLRQQKLKSIFLAIVCVMAVLISGFGWMISPQYVPYSEDLLTVTENEDGMVIISINEENATGYEISGVILSDDGESYTLTIHAWKTIWDETFSDHEVPNIVVSPGDPIQAIYYSPNPHGESIRIYGTDEDVSTLALPRLSLRYYLMLAGLAVVLGVALLFFFRKFPELKIWIERFLLLPLAYILSHVITKGFVTITYAMTRDLAFILIDTVLIFAAGLLGLSLYRTTREMELPKNF